MFDALLSTGHMSKIYKLIHLQIHVFIEWSSVGAADHIMYELPLGLITLWKKSTNMFYSTAESDFCMVIPYCLVFLTSYFLKSASPASVTNFQEQLRDTMTHHCP